ncbi:MAG TPA: hypothetical protein VMU79_12045 [Casimicrobiaceae bacterium]|jgi:hypothetical protein|nr:hypothetical protein [Casimicrobiaceae bacterium]
MRSILTLILVALTALLTGCCCRVIGYEGNPNFSDPFQNDLIGPTTPNFPIALNFPDETMFFFPMYDDRRSSDLAVVAMQCSRAGDGVVVTARVENLGSSPIAPEPFRSGELSALRVSAIVTTANGARERLDGASMLPLTVSGTLDMSMGPTLAAASDIVRIDVIADPARIVPDPLRDNNVLSWQGSLRPDAPDCKIER